MSDAAAPDPFGVGLPLDTEVSRPRPGTVLLEVDGEIDTATAPACRPAWTRRWTLPTPRAPASWST